MKFEVCVVCMCVLCIVFAICVLPMCCTHAVISQHSHRARVEMKSNQKVLSYSKSPKGYCLIPPARQNIHFAVEIVRDTAKFDCKPENRNMISSLASNDAEGHRADPGGSKSRSLLETLHELCVELHTSSTWKPPGA